MSAVHRSPMLCSCLDEVEVGNSSELDSGLVRAGLKMLMLKNHFLLHEKTTIVHGVNYDGLHPKVIPIGSVY